MSKPNPFRYFRTSREIIRLAVMMYVRFPLSLRNVEDLLHERGIDVSHESVRFWWMRFGPLFASEIRKARIQRMRCYSNHQWHLDEVFVKINGETHYMWRAVDHEGEVLDAFVTKRRDRKAALKFLRKLMKRYGQPDRIVTDKLRSYGDAWSEYSVLLFRNQTLDHESHVAFSRRFGALDNHDSIPKFRDQNIHEILRVANDVVGGRKQTVGQQWHSDLSITQQPAKASLLRSDKLPPKGGDTLFASSYQAYEDLSPAMKTFLEGLSAVHDIAQSKQNKGRADLDEARQRTPPVVHPVVRTHSVTGKKAIYVNEMSTSRIVELAPEESEAVLQFLFAHTTQHKYTYRHRWQVGDLLMWDNESTQHLALADYDIEVPRVLYRTTLLGVPSGRLATENELT